MRRKSHAIALMLLLSFSSISYASATTDERTLRREVVVLVAEFTDARFSRSMQDVESLLSDVELVFTQASSDKLRVDATLIPTKYVLRNTFSYYNRDGFDNDVFLQDLISLADKEVDFHGKWVLVVHAGEANPTGSAINSQMRTPTDETIRGTARIDSTLFTAAAVHELAHIFGYLPDLYDRFMRLGMNGKQFMNDVYYYELDIMASKTHGGFSSYSKMKLWWTCENVFTVKPGEDRTVTIFPVDSCADNQICAVKIPVDNVRYYLVEAREVVDEFSSILHPGFEGVIVSYVDESIPTGSGPVRLMSINGYLTQYAEAYVAEDDVLFASPEHNFVVSAIDTKDEYTIRIAPLENMIYHDPVEVKIRVTDDLNTPMENIPIDVTKDGFLVGRLRSDQHGVATFAAFNPGEYVLAAGDCFRCPDTLMLYFNPEQENEIHIAIGGFMSQILVILVAVIAAGGLMAGIIIKRNGNRSR